MIQIAKEGDKKNVKQMWKICFDDSEEFMDIYFSEKYQNENTLIYFEQNRPVASLQLLPYFFTFYGIEVPISYISGACTLPKYRKRGCMTKLLTMAFEIMQERKTPISILIPADNYLCSYYKNFGFETVFDTEEESGFLKNILNEAITDFEGAYFRFDSLFRNKDFCIQKSKTDFKTIVKDASTSNIYPNYNLPGMSRLIDVEQLLNIFASKNPDKKLSIKLNDNIFLQNNAFFSIENGKCTKSEKKIKNCFKMNVNILCRLLFGYHIEQLPDKKLSQYFDSHHPILNLMME
jgi:predicted acetyltransferase